MPKITKAEKRYNEIVDRYISAYFKYNGRKPFKIFFKNGWVNLHSLYELSSSKYRVSDFEEMMKTLENRINKT